ncbi:hypothetical protein HY638_01845 [Candidatus Woesearchaeota archaeon]|nr:hypothetical protein [Candidatus Woesearchaeota archaeon]
MEIAEGYKGELHAAITKFKGMYDVSFALSQDGLDTLLKEKRDMHGPGFVSIREFYSINDEAFKLLQDAAKRMEQKKEVDIGNLLG